mgnify:CR=1 FL=1
MVISLRETEGLAVRIVEMAKAATYTDQEFLEYLVKSLIDNPDKVSVERKVDEMGVLLTLKVAPEDMGKIIGRSGNTAKAIRSLLRIVGIKNNARVNLKIEEPEGSTHVARQAGGSVEDMVGELKL